MKILKFLAAVAVAAALPLHAQVNPDSLKAELKKKIPEAPIESVRKTQYGGPYEVIAGGEIFYTDEKASFISLGPLVDLKTHENVTEARLRVVNAINFHTLPFDSAIKI